MQLKDPPDNSDGSFFIELSEMSAPREYFQISVLADSMKF